MMVTKERQLFWCFSRNQVRPVSTVTMPHDRPPKKRPSILGRVRGLSVLKNVITGPWFSVISYSVNNRRSFPRDKRVGA